MQKLTEAEKKARGTQQRCRKVKARKRSEIRADLANVNQCIVDMQFNLTESTKEIRTLGMFIEMGVTDNNGTMHVARKLNPAFSIQKQAMTMLRQLRRNAVMLREEEADATATEDKTTNDAAHQFRKPVFTVAAQQQPEEEVTEEDGDEAQQQAE